MKLRKQGGILVVVVALLAAGLMLGRFALAEDSYRPLTALSPSRSDAGAGHIAKEGQININTATEEELDKLPGIGMEKAAAIVNWRREHGPFRYPEELIRVPGIGEGILADILDHITAGGE